MIDSRRFLRFGIAALSILAACSGKVAVEPAGDPAATSAGSAGSTEAPGAAGGAVASGGAAGPAGAGGEPCCLSIPVCDSGDDRLSSEECPSDGTCYERNGCCGSVIRCAHFEPPLVDAGPPDMPSDCSLVGVWSAKSAPWNGESTATELTFNGDGTLSGTPMFTGEWSMSEGRLDIEQTVGPDMNCALPSTWSVSFSAACQAASFLPTGDACTGARRYLDGTIALRREHLR